MPLRKQIQHIYWFAHFNLDCPSVRYRGKYPLDYAWTQRGITSNLVIPGYQWTQIMLFLSVWAEALIRPKPNSIIVIQRVRSKFVFAHLLKLLVWVRKERSVYDLDDADYLKYDPQTIHFFARNCHYLMAGSEAIAQYFQAFNQQIFFQTSPVVNLDLVKKQRNTLFTVGWVGGYRWAHRESLYRSLFPTLKALSFPCRLLFLGVNSQSEKQEIEAYFQSSSHLLLDIPVDIDWNNEREVQHYILQFDLGVATLSDQLYHRSKSGIKAKQYLNNGVPVLTPNLPENNRYVKHEVNGLYCESAEEFAAAISRFRSMSEE